MGNLNAIKVKTLYFVLFSIIYWAAIYMLYNSNQDIIVKLKVFSVVLLIMNILIIIMAYRIPVMLIISLFMLNYSYVLTIPAYYYPTKISGIPFYNNNTLLLEVILQCTIGMFFIIWFLFTNSKELYSNRFLQDKIDKFSANKNDGFVMFVSLLGFLVLFILNNSGKQTNLPLSLTFEYIFIFVIIYKIYSKDNLINKIIVHTMLIGIGIKTLMTSGRIEVVEALVLLFIFYYEKRVRSFLIIIGSILLNILLEFISIFRTGGDVSWSTSKFFFDRSNPPTLILGNEGDVTQSSMAMIGVIKDLIVDSSIRFNSFTDMLISQFIPLGGIESFNPNVARYIQEITVTLGGGFIYSQWYFWLGISGVIICCILINYIIKIAYLSRNVTSLTIMAIYSLALFVRWYAYFFDFLIKIPLILFVLLFLIGIITSRRSILPSRALSSRY
ncbi:hypothetical protein AB1K91_19680 [Terribacillus sp. 179-K 1B1 HS]|uniref:hypothetical protein n=1 Tax=Terribacillus sp. 179-K 1B1 HS TaxID=3142388 RepID=UPI0039A20070